MRRSPLARAQAAVSAVALAFGLAGLLVARSVDFTAARGALLGPADFELGSVTLNPLGALLCIATAGVGLAGALLGRRSLVVGAGAAFVAQAVLVLVQWGGGTNWTGGRGSNVSLFVGAGFGLLALAAAERAGGRPAPTTP